MQMTIALGEKRYTVDLARPLDISIPVRFNDNQPDVFGGPPATRVALQAGSFIGDVRRGGSCNCWTYTITPHTCGTHTECVGHISDAPIAIHDILKDSLIPATLITIAPQKPGVCRESYDPTPRENDALIARAALAVALKNAAPEFLTGLIIRTIPNAPDKRTRSYTPDLSPFFSTQAIQYLNSLGIRHLLVDSPSIDRLDDEGKLSNHRIFWNMTPGSHTVDESHPSPKTVTEFIYVPDAIADGIYLLNLQVAPLMADAAPSRPILYGITAP